MIGPISDQQTRKSWLQVSVELRCPIIGFCLTTAEERGILKKAGIPLGELTDHDRHRLLVQSAGSDASLARRIQRRLERKYRQEIKARGTYAESALLDHWEAQLRCGEIGAALWIVATHPSLSREAVDSVLADTHMLMHRQGELITKELRQAQRLRAENERLSVRLHKAWSRHQEITEALEVSNRARVELEFDLVRLRKSLKERKCASSYRGQLKEAERQIQTKDVVIERLEGENERLEAENERLVTEMASVNQLSDVMREEWQAVLRSLRQADDACDTCPSYDLCDRRVLIVGGMNRLRTAYQVLVEDLGGEFQHHDGHAISDGALAALVGWADIVLCPVDVNSHGACLGVKRACKKMGKPYDMLRSSGVSTVARALAQFCRPVDEPRL